MMDDMMDLDPPPPDMFDAGAAQAKTPPSNMPTTDEVVSKWNELFAANEFSDVTLKNHWKVWVPQIYSPANGHDCLNWQFKEPDAKIILFDTLERFIGIDKPQPTTATSGNSEKRIDQQQGNATVCGRVFKLGEPTYSCRECAMDSTCVLCVNCFKVSEHRMHKYRMSTSQGGGCCDCGDEEAWRRDPYCQIHKGPNRSDDDESETVRGGNFDETSVVRVRYVFDAILWYAHNVLIKDQIADIRLGGDISDTFFASDTYCTILYNDEVHTFEQVISTLIKVLKCSQRRAIEFVTSIDREGRAVVMCAPFQYCNVLRDDIDKYTSRHGNKPLRAHVNHAHVIAHQLFAMRLLTWLREVLASCGAAYRRIFAEVATTDKRGTCTSLLPCIIKTILLNDSQLWKSARSQWQRVLISGMLLEYENKKQLATIFTRNYGQVVKDFIKDDHDHTYSIASLSVQLFTVPTLAHHLLAHHDLMYILLNTFMSECVTKCNKLGKLEFERSPASSVSFKRAHYMLYDLKYLLNLVPSQWTDDLRKCFLHGLNSMYELFAKMQGMDAVTREVGQHIEFEPEWESAFNLHIRFAEGITSALRWCGSDRIVLVKSYRALLKRLFEEERLTSGAGEHHQQQQQASTSQSAPMPIGTVVVELADHSASCIAYDCSSSPVSIHLPLSRFLAGLHTFLGAYGLSFDGPEFQTTAHPKPSPVQIMEPVLRAQVMIAQVHAGMWRRNGYALLNQLYFYHNLKFRNEMLDRDVALMQMCAALIESNEFMIHLLYKYNLVQWAGVDYEVQSMKTTEESDSVRQTISLVEEFLRLLVVLVGERHTPGVGENVTAETRMEKEIIHALCIKPRAHSELSKLVVEDVNYDVSIDDIITRLAVFKTPLETAGKGVYELKDEFYDEYNVFYYHYTREELSKSEVAQRQRRKTAGALECCPPPKLTKLSDAYAMIVNLLQCDVMLYIMQLVMERCSNLRARSFSELQLHKVLHLIGYALNEEESNNYPFFKFIQNSAKFRLQELMIGLVGCPRVDAHKDLLKWTIERFQRVGMAKNQQIRNVQELLPTASSSTSDPSITSVNVEEDEKERRARLAAARRAKVMAQMAAAQKNFIEINAELFENVADVKYYHPKTESVSESNAMDTGEVQEQPVALGINQSPSVRYAVDTPYICILCQEVEKITPKGRGLVMSAFTQKSTVLNQCRSGASASVENFFSKATTCLHANLGPAVYTSTCGHVMHTDCWKKFFENVKLREQRRPYRLRHPSSFDVDKNEFLCPLCECLSNTVLPLVPKFTVPPLPYNLIQQLQPDDAANYYTNFLDCVERILLLKIEVCHGNFECETSECPNDHCLACTKKMLHLTHETECEMDWCFKKSRVFYKWRKDDGIIDMRLQRLIDPPPVDFATFEHFSDGLNETVKKFTHNNDLKYPTNIGETVDRHHIPINVYKTLAYTIHVIEVILRDSATERSLLGHLSNRQMDCIEYMIRVTSVMHFEFQNSVLYNYALECLEFLFYDHRQNISIDQWDAFALLVALTFSMPTVLATNIGCNVPVPNGSQLDLCLLRTVFVAHCVQLLSTLDLSGLETEHRMDVSNENVKNYPVLYILKQLERINEDALNKINLELLWLKLQEAALPFLRCCCLFYHFVTNVPPPFGLTQIGGDTFEVMCKYLALPMSTDELFTYRPVMKMIEKWCHNTNYMERKKQCSASTLENLGSIIGPPVRSKLIDLPLDYSDLINSVSTFKCPSSDEVSRTPAMCLVCGVVLCSQSYCCQTLYNQAPVGSCNIHAYKCGAGVGLFLRIRECEILYLAMPSRGCFVNAPYLDAYGETDMGLRRGNPLRLCQQRYKKLQTLWLNHGIHEEISRSIIANSHILTTQWHHL